MLITNYNIDVTMGNYFQWSIRLIIFVGIAFVFMLLPTMNGYAKTITVDDDGGADYLKIQDAIDASWKGGIIRVYEGYYEENLIINHSIQIIGNGSHNTIIGAKNRNDHVIRADAENIRISDIGICNGSAGIIISEDHIELMNVRSYMNSFGVSLFYCGNTCIENLSCSNNTSSGINIQFSHNFSITSSIFFSNYHGISSYMAKDGEISRCVVQNNEYSGVILSSGYRNTLDNTTIENHIGNYSYGILVGGSSNTISNCTINNNSLAGVSLQEGTDWTEIQDSSIFMNGIGIYIHDLGKSNTITRCNVYDNYQSGINTTHTVYAKWNWWGDPTGPHHDVLNPKGNGNKVEGNVLIDPWSNAYINNIPKILIHNIGVTSKVDSVILIEGIAWDIDGEVKKVEFSYDGDVWTTVNGTKNWEIDWNTTSVPDGKYDIMIRSWDGQDYSLIEKIHVDVDNHGDDSNTLTMILLIVLLITVVAILTAVIVDLTGMRSARSK